MTGLLKNGKVIGRPADVLKIGEDEFFVTDDYAGVIYYVRRKSGS